MPYLSLTLAVAGLWGAFIPDAIDHQYLGLLPWFFIPLWLLGIVALVREDTRGTPIKEEW